MRTAKSTGLDYNVCHLFSLNWEEETKICLQIRLVIRLLSANSLDTDQARALHLDFVEAVACSGGTCFVACLCYCCRARH